MIRVGKYTEKTARAAARAVRVFFSLIQKLRPRIFYGVGEGVAVAAGTYWVAVFTVVVHIAES